jgi:hypothetical protein
MRSLQKSQKKKRQQKRQKRLKIPHKSSSSELKPSLLKVIYETKINH